MTTRMVAPEADMCSASIDGFNYEIKKDDKWGRIVDAHPPHVAFFRNMGFKPVSEMPYSPPVDLSQIMPEVDAEAEAAAKAKLEADQAEQDRLVAEAKAAEEKAAAEAAEAERIEAERVAAEAADAEKLEAERAAKAAEAEAPKKGKGK